MQHTVYTLRNFYSSRSGRLIRRLLLSHIMGLWTDAKDMRIVGCGYAVPYMKALRAAGAERVVAMMPAVQGGHAWPEDAPNLVALADDTELPLETESVDRVLLVHALEHTEFPEDQMREIWRVLKSNGRLLIIVPNRLGLWARADWTPFGHGRPWSMGQIHHFLEESMFIHERTERALFMPPFRSFLMLRSAYMLESIGRTVFPGLAGVYIVEASKQVYAARPKGTRAVRKRPGLLVPETAALGRGK